jgi:threonine synthase
VSGAAVQVEERCRRCASHLSNLAVRGEPVGVAIGLTCPRCGAEYAAEPRWDGCPACRPAGLGVNLWPRYDEAAVARTLTRAALAGRPWDMWRYEELLPVDPERRVALGEGGTPLTALPRLAGRHGLARLYAKDETRNPTWSFKDRLAAVAVSRAVEAGAPVVLDSSTGNQGAATAAHAAKAGLPAVVFTFGRVPWTMKVFMAAYGAMVLQIDDGPARRRTLEACVRELGWYPVCNVSDPPVGGNPYGLEGYKTIAFEVCEQLGWRPPDVIVFPTDYGDALARTSKGLLELRRLGLIDRLPRLVAAERFGALAHALAAGLDRVPPVPAGPTVAISIDTDVSTVQALDAIRATGGIATAVPEEAIVAAQLEAARVEGLFPEPSSACALAAARQLREQGWIGAQETVVAFITSMGLKDPAATRPHLPEPPFVEPTVEATLRALRDVYGFRGQGRSAR